MKISIFFVLLLLPVMIFSQELKLNKKIKSNTDFEHPISGISAPMNLGNFSRIALQLLIFMLHLLTIAFLFMTPEAERFNGWAAMLGFVAAVGAYVTTGQIIPGWF